MARITSIKYEKLVSFHPHGNRRLMVEVALDENDNPDTEFHKAHAFVDSLHKRFQEMDGKKAPKAQKGVEAPKVAAATEAA